MLTSGSELQIVSPWQPSQSDPLQGKVLAETYEIIRLLGKGGMGRVYEVGHTRLTKKRYAVKLLHSDAAADSEAYARFRREAMIVTEIGHPNIVEVYDFNVTSDGQPFIVMEYLAGENLYDCLQRRGTLLRSEVLRIMTQVTGALAAAHAAGIVHRDLKPENIFLVQQKNGEPEAKLLDFGLSKIKHSESHLTREHAIFGTPQYMSPEQADGKIQDVGQRSDIYALGVIIYQCLCGEVPFDAPTPLGILFKVINEVPQPPTALSPQLPPEIDAVLARAMAKRREERYQSVEAFMQALSPILERPGRMVPSMQNEDTATTVERVLPQSAAAYAETVLMETGGEAAAVQPGVDAAPGGTPDEQGPTWRMVDGEDLAQAKSRQESRATARAVLVIGLTLLLGGSAASVVLLLAMCDTVPAKVAAHVDGSATRVSAKPPQENGAVSDLKLAPKQDLDQGHRPQIDAAAGASDQQIRASDQRVRATRRPARRRRARRSPQKKVRARPRRHGLLTVATVAGGQKIWADIYINGASIGKSLIYRKRYRVGQYVVVARRPGYTEARRTIQLKAGQEERVLLKLRKLRGPQ